MKSTRRDDRLQAFAWVRQWKEAPPDGVTSTQWARIEALLYLIARHYPRCFLSQETMAEKLRWPLRTVERYVGMAKAHSVIQVDADAGTKRRGGYRYTNVYHIMQPPSWRVRATANLADKGTVGRTSLPFPQEAPTERELRSLSSVAWRAAPGPATTVTKVPRLSAAEALAAAAERGRIKARPKAQDPDPARRLVRYFLDQWELHGREDVRPLDSVGEARQYLRNTFLSPAAGRKYTEAEVRAFLDQFLTAVERRQVQMKQGQSAWRRFTGWWGRKDAPVDNVSVIEEYFRTKGETA